MENNKIQIGKIVAVSGIKGEVKILSYCQNPKDIAKYNIFDNQNQKINLKITKLTSKTTKDGGVILIANINGINNRNDAEKIIGVDIFSNRSEFKKTKKDEFYYSDLIGLKVLNKKNQEIGTVIDVLNFGAGDLIEIEFASKNIAGNSDKIENFPFKNDFFSKVSIEDGFVIFNYE